MDVKKFGRIAVLLGGKSREREISIRSGEAVYQALSEKGADAIKIDTAENYLTALKKQHVDLVFIALHGHGGEDGTVQYVLEAEGFFYVGSGPAASALAFNKALAKQEFLQTQIPTPSYERLNSGNFETVLNRWHAPYVIKPSEEGSSIGVSMIRDAEEGKRKAREALSEFPDLLIEQKIEGREFTVGILGSEALPVIELKSKRAFYDYEAKYTKGFTEYSVPAPISPPLTRALQALALKTHQVLGLRDFSRIDFMVDGKGAPYVLEANSIPGFTETSLLPKAARCIGMSFDDLCLTLLEMAFERKQIHLRKPVLSF